MKSIKLLIRRFDCRNERRFVKLLKYRRIYFIHLVYIVETRHNRALALELGESYGS